MAESRARWRAGIRARGPESEQGSRRWKTEKELGCSMAMAGRARGASAGRGELGRADARRERLASTAGHRTWDEAATLGRRPSQVRARDAAMAEGARLGAPRHEQGGRVQASSMAGSSRSKTRAERTRQGVGAGHRAHGRRNRESKAPEAGRAPWKSGRAEHGAERKESGLGVRPGKRLRLGIGQEALAMDGVEDAGHGEEAKHDWGWGLLDLYPAGGADNGEEQRRLERRLDDDGGLKQISPPAVSDGQGKIAGQGRCWEQLVPRRHGK
jgi:hypothetical protein